MKLSNADNATNASSQHDVTKGINGLGPLSHDHCRKRLGWKDTQVSVNTVTWR